MIWEGPPLEATVEALRSMGIESVVFDPCGNTPDDGDFLSTMRGGLRALTSARKP
jgi:zinc transport system substrate-binding protein